MTRLLLLCCALLSACASTVKPDPVPVVVESPKAKVTLDPELLQECSPHLALLEARAYTESDLVTKQIPVWATQYDDCSTRHSKLIGIVRDAFNLEPRPSK